jgi:hypothetical protein
MLWHETCREQRKCRFVRVSLSNLFCRICLTHLSSESLFWIFDTVVSYTWQHISNLILRYIVLIVLLLFVRLSAVYTSDIEADVLDAWAYLLLPESCLASVAPSGQARSLCVLHSGQSSRTCSGVWLASGHAHLADSDWFIRLGVPSFCSGRYVGGRWWLPLSEVGCPGHGVLIVKMNNFQYSPSTP